MYLSAILAFCTISAPRKTGSTNPQQQPFPLLSVILRALGLLGLALLTFAFRGQDGHRIVTLWPLHIHTEWYGILGLIGWAYLVGALVFLVFRGNVLALLGSMVLLLCLYAADRTGAFEHFWLSKYLGIGEMLGSHAAITVAGILLAIRLRAPDGAFQPFHRAAPVPGAAASDRETRWDVSALARLAALLRRGRTHSGPAISEGGINEMRSAAAKDSVWSQTRFTLLFIAGFASAAWLLTGLYGINKNSATPSWCLWACAFTAALWLLFYFLADVKRVAWVARPLAVAGQNVLLAYLLSEMLPSLIDLLHLNQWYARLAEPNLFFAIIRSSVCGVIILCVTAGLNRIGFRLKL